MKPRPLALAVLAAAAALAGCGKMGDLERPGPLFGRAKPAAEADRQAREPSRPVLTIDPRDRDRNTDLTPSRSLPIGGQSPNPTETAPQGALPDPYANPQ